MIITLAKHGGLAAAINLRLPPEVLDTATLPEPAAARLTQLVAAAVSAPGQDEADRARDAMSYTITIEDGGRSTVLSQSDTAMSPGFAALLTWLEDHFARQ
ncbi:protealysin inhibitor emfourin [Kitasatospora sp. NPDC056531]|uniref:protealysin inhibitor emfourin n=1 Tax=Kitasatospora sp. NPDC056531 TaxID=3345856 RepID=UPI00368990F4